MFQSFIFVLFFVKLLATLVLFSCWFPKNGFFTGAPSSSEGTPRRRCSWETGGAAQGTWKWPVHQAGWQLGRWEEQLAGLGSFIVLKTSDIIMIYIYILDDII